MQKSGESGMSGQTQPVGESGFFVGRAPERQALALRSWRPSLR